MRIIIDAFGGDNAPDEIIKGCRLAADELHVQIVLTGDEKKIRAAAEKLNSAYRKIKSRLSCI